MDTHRMDALERLSKLLDDGRISQAEYESLKKDFLTGPNTSTSRRDANPEYVERENASPDSDREMLVSAGRIGRIFGVDANTVRQWRRRYDNFPEPETTNPYPMYDVRKMQRWYASRWPERLDRWHMRIHRYEVSPDGVRLTTQESGNLDFAQGYIEAVRDLMFDDWRVFYTKDGFSAYKGTETEVWVIDPTDFDPEPWDVYDIRFRTRGEISKEA